MQGSRRVYFVLQKQQHVYTAKEKLQNKKKKKGNNVPTNLYIALL